MQMQPKLTIEGTAHIYSPPRLGRLSRGVGEVDIYCPLFTRHSKQSGPRRLCDTVGALSCHIQICISGRVEWTCVHIRIGDERLSDV